MLGDLLFSEGGYKPASLKSVEIHGCQEDIIASIVVRQIFVNNSESEKECVYRHAVNDSLCSYGLRFVVDGKEIQPVLRMKEEASKCYKEGLNRGLKSIYGEDSGNGVGLYRVGNLPVGKECIVEEKYGVIATRNTKGYHIKIPMKTNHQIGCVTDSLAQEFKFDFRVRSQFEITGIEVDGIDCDVEENKEEGFFTVKLGEGKTINSSTSAIHLNVSANISKEGLGVLIGNYAAIDLFPDFKIPVETNSEFYFIVDCSGSMSGKRIKSAQQCLELFIKSLPIGCRFSIILFGSNYEVLVPVCEYGDSTMNDAMEKISRISADLGGTDLYSPLLHVFQTNPQSGFAKQIFVLTDGETEKSDMCIAECAKAAQSNRVFAVGIGDADPGVIEGMSAATHGASAFIKESDDLKSKVIELLGSAISGMGVDTQIFASGSEFIETSPHPLPIIFNKAPTTIFLKGADSCEGTVLVTCNVCGETVEIPIEVAHPSKKSEEEALEETIRALYSHRAIKEFEWRVKQNPEYREKAAKLSIESGVLSKYTAYVGVDSVEQKPEPVYPRKILNARGGNYRCKCNPISDALCGGRRSCKERVAPLGCAQRLTKAANPMMLQGIDTYSYSSNRGNHNIFGPNSFEDNSFSAFSKPEKKLIPKKNDTDPDSNLDIIYKQKADGSWPESLAKNSELIEKYGKVAAATIEAIVEIKKNNSAAYSLVIKKGLNFLASIDSSINWSEVIDELLEH